MYRVTRAVRRLVAVAACLGLAWTVTGCDESTQDEENKVKEAAYEKIVANQPIESPEYSVTRDTINRWVRTWGKSSAKNKLAYVYIQNANGQYGYFVTKGLPVSYCSLGTPPSKVKSSSNGMVLVPLPGLDGTYSQGSGACNTYYAFDATTGAYMEFTVGVNQSFFLFDRPSTLPEFADARQMGPTSLEDAAS